MEEQIRARVERALDAGAPCMACPLYEESQECAYDCKAAGAYIHAVKSVLDALISDVNEGIAKLKTS